LAIKQRKLCIAKEKPDITSNIDVIIVAKENFAVIKSCLDSVIPCNFQTIFLCLDNPEKALVENLKSHFQTIEIIENHHLKGKIETQLCGLKKSNNNDVLLLDADIKLFPHKINDFIHYHKALETDFLCPYSVGVSEKKSLWAAISESDRIMRQRIVRAGRDYFGVSNLSGYCMLANRKKYIEILDSKSIQDDVIATINLFKKNYSVKTYHRAICSEIERSSFTESLFQKTRWTAGNIRLLSNYPQLFTSIPLIKAFAFTTSFLLWYWALWIDFICFLFMFSSPIVIILIILELFIKILGLFIVGEQSIKRIILNFVYVIIWPLFSILCLLMTPAYLGGKIEGKTRRKS
jgi:cellulose synthase/poly-beta-1,6-N-acetylglucosamine synthase-like glycosyltransferase